MPTRPFAERARDVLSDEALVLVAPFRGYAILSASPSRGARAAFARAAAFLAVVGVTGAITTAGRLVPAHVALIALAWSFVPVLQAITAAVVSRRSTNRLPIARAIELHLAGNGPALLFFFALAALVLLAPDVGGAFRWLLARGVLPAAVVATLTGGAVTSFAFYRVCGGDSRRRAFALLGLE
jgi:hypothetical protein